MDPFLLDAEGAEEGDGRRTTVPADGVMSTAMTGVGPKM